MAKDVTSTLFESTFLLFGVVIVIGGAVWAILGDYVKSLEAVGWPIPNRWYRLKGVSQTLPVPNVIDKFMAANYDMSKKKKRKKDLLESQQK